jgi:hypothetical protein
MPRLTVFRAALFTQGYVSCLLSSSDKVTPPSSKTKAEAVIKLLAQTKSGREENGAANQDRGVLFGHSGCRPFAQSGARRGSDIK